MRARRVWTTVSGSCPPAGRVLSAACAEATSSASGGLQPGDDRSADVKGTFQTSANRLQKTGHSDQLVLEGIYLATDDNGTIELAVVHRGRVYVNVPTDVFVPDFNPGDVIALVVKVEDDGSFTLVKADDESGDDDGDGDHVGQHQFSVNGVLSAIGDSVSVTVDGDSRGQLRRSGRLRPVRLRGRQHVVMTCKYGGHPVTISLQKKTPAANISTRSGRSPPSTTVDRPG